MLSKSQTLRTVKSGDAPSLPLPAASHLTAPLTESTRGAHIGVAVLLTARRRTGGGWTLTAASADG